MHLEYVSTSRDRSSDSAADIFVLRPKSSPRIKLAGRSRLRR